MFAIDPAFNLGAEPLARLVLCDVWLQRDARYPWLVLIPRVAGAVELEDLPADDRARLVEEIVITGAAVRAMGVAVGRPVAKLNIGALGNVTRQLHIHVVGRRPDDAAWPGPVWGQGEAIPYDAGAVETVRAAALAALAPQEGGAPGRVIVS